MMERALATKLARLALLFTTVALRPIVTVGRENIAGIRLVMQPLPPHAQVAIGNAR